MSPERTNWIKGSFRLTIVASIILTAVGTIAAILRPVTVKKESYDLTVTRTHYELKPVYEADETYEVFGQGFEPVRIEIGDTTQEHYPNLSLKETQNTISRIGQHKTEGQQVEFETKDSSIILVSYARTVLKAAAFPASCWTFFGLVLSLYFLVKRAIDFIAEGFRKT